MDLIDTFLSGYTRVLTQRAYGSDLRLFTENSRVTHENVSEIFSPRRIESYFQSLTAGSPRSATVKRRQAAMKAFLKWVTETLHIDTSKSLERLQRTVVEPNAVARELHVIRKEQVDTLLSAADSPRDRAVLLLILDCSLRRSEVAAIQMFGPDFGADALRFTGMVHRLESGASIQQVQVHARHKNIETTMMYVHQRDRLRDSAADHIHIKKS